MVGIDTNVLVRYFTIDDDAQAEKAAKFFDYYSGKKASIFINNIVICELIWVLIRLYKYNKSEVVDLVKVILSTVEFAFEDHNFLLKCLQNYEESEADFADILIGNMNLKYACKTTYTFDKKATKLEFFQII